jgi:diguanylate cyclase (GGDEF)-like protein
MLQFDPLSPRQPVAPLEAVAVALQGARQENDTLRSCNERLQRELSEVTRRELDARTLAHHDGLTGLPNRRLLRQKLALAIDAAHNEHRNLALLFIDLDGFKRINDRLGHASGDKLLGVIANRISARVRSGDFACRYGGDEFVVLLQNVDDTTVTTGIASDIRTHISRPCTLGDTEVQISASIGMAMYPQHGEHCDALLNYADASMYRDKLSAKPAAAILQAQRNLG